MAAAVLIAARQPSQQTEVASISAPPKAMLPEEIVAAETERAAGRGRPVGRKRVNGTRGSAGPT